MLCRVYSPFLGNSLIRIDPIHTTHFLEKILIRIDPLYTTNFLENSSIRINPVFLEKPSGWASDVLSCCLFHKDDACLVVFMNINRLIIYVNLCVRYVVDAADRDNISISRSELHDLLSKPSLHGIPLLVLGNKIDRQPEALSKQAFIDQM